MSLCSDRILRIRRLVDPAVLLPWPDRSKGECKKWKHLQLTHMNDDRHLAKLKTAGNIGIALGKVSDGLVTADLDHDSDVEAFLVANPALASTLRTRAARGCNIWVRCNGEYPPLQKLKNAYGSEIGEWRSDGGQTIIAGTHPHGMLYQFVVEKPVITIPYETIIWPASILPPRATESNRVRRVGEDKVVSEGAAGASCGLIEAFVGAALMSQITPTSFHQNNASLFKLARLVKSYEASIGRVATKEELQFFFDRWCLTSHRFWRHTREDYWAEFLQAYHYARVGLDEDPIQLALSRAEAEPLPEVPGFRDERVRLLVAICREMQQLVGNSSFFLPTRKLGVSLGVCWSTVARWLVALETLSIIRLAPGEVRKRGGIRCPRYHYGPATYGTMV
jgi:Bifunctional DNA primase/polymerase, N-terminal